MYLCVIMLLTHHNVIYCTTWSDMNILYAHLQRHASIDTHNIAIYMCVTIFGKINHLRASTEIHFLPVHERYIHALFRNTKH